MESSHQSRVMDNENAALALLLKLPKCGMRISFSIFLPSNLLQEKLGLCMLDDHIEPIPSGPLSLWERVRERVRPAAAHQPGNFDLRHALFPFAI